MAGGGFASSSGGDDEHGFERTPPGLAGQGGPGRIRKRFSKRPARAEPARRLPLPRSRAADRPTDTGGLFIGRRPATGPVHYRGAPERGGAGRRLADGVLAALVLALEVLLCLSVWGPQPLAWLWVGSQADYATGSDFLGIGVAFVGILRRCS